MGIFQRVSTDGFKIPELVRLAAEHSLTVELANLPSDFVETPLFSGRLLVHELQPGLIVAASDIQYLTDQSIDTQAEPSLQCGVLLAGEDESIEVVGYGSITRQPRRPVLKAFSQPTQFRLPSMLGRRSRTAGFMLKPNFFDRFGAHVTDDGLKMLQELSASPFRFECLPRSPRIIELAENCLNHPFNEQLSELFLESNTLAFVIEVAQLLKQERRLVSLIGKRHYDRVMETRDILDAKLAAPPRMLELSRQVGVNHTTLQANFKAVFGSTIFGYVRTQRLLMARALLVDHHVTVAEAGYRVGFASPAAFTAAYRRHFGHPPGQDLARDRV